jgi:integrase
MWVKMDYVKTHGDGRLLFKRDIPPDLRAVAGRTTWQRSLRTRKWDATAAALHRQYMAESDRDIAQWRGEAGNRISEFAQLRVSDVLREGDYIGLQITDSGDDQHIKNEGSARTVPLHPRIRGDFERFLEGHERNHGTQRLFPLLKPDVMKRSGGRWSTWFTKYRKENGIYVRRQDAHSFRHSYITACRNAGIDVSIFSRWTGHKLSEVVHKYGDMSLAALAKDIGKVRFDGVTVPAWEPGSE